MGIVDKYFSKEFMKLLGLFQVTFLFIYLVIEFIEKIDNFIEANVSNNLMFTYLFYKIPYIMVQMVPVATLLSVIVMLCLMEKNNEVTALRACGINLIQLSKPIIKLSLLIGVAVFLVSELIVPYASSRSNEIWGVKVNKRDRTYFYGQNQVWYRGKNAIYWIRHFDAKKNSMEDVTFYFFDDSFQLVKRIDARKGIWTGHNWKIREGMLQQARNGNDYALEKFDEIDLAISEGPEDFVRTVRKPEEMSYWQLKRYAEKMRGEGYDPTAHLVDMNIKLAFPLISLVMVIIGIPVALGLKRGGTPLAVSLGVAICFLYLLTLGFARSLGLSGILPPILSAWLANAVFFFSGAYLMMRVET